LHFRRRGQPDHDLKTENCKRTKGSEEWVKKGGPTSGTTWAPKILEKSCARQKMEGRRRKGMLGEKKTNKRELFRGRGIKPGKGLWPRKNQAREGREKRPMRD